MSKNETTPEALKDVPTKGLFRELHQRTATCKNATGYDCLFCQEDKGEAKRASGFKTLSFGREDSLLHYFTPLCQECLAEYVNPEKRRTGFEDFVGGSDEFIEGEWEGYYHSFYELRTHGPYELWSTRDLTTFVIVPKSIRGKLNDSQNEETIRWKTAR